MGNLLDKFESLILNYSRRIISAAIFIVLIIMSWNFLAGLLNTFDSPNTEGDDSFSMPEFIEPFETADFENVNDRDSETSDTGEEKKQVDLDYSDEIDEMAETIFPLYISLRNFAPDQENSIREYLSERVSEQIYDGLYTENQRDDWVDGAVDYIDDLSDYMMDKYDISSRNPVAIDVELSSEDNEFLDRPLSLYSIDAAEALSDHLAEVSEAKDIAANNNLEGVGQLFTVLYTLGAVIFMVLMLLIFKAENSLRRSADAIEKD